MLNAIRFGELDQKTIAEFQKLSRSVVYDDGIEPTELYFLSTINVGLFPHYTMSSFATRREVDNANDTRLKQLSGSLHVYTSMDIPGFDAKDQRISHDQMERLLERLVAAKTVNLKASMGLLCIVYSMLILMYDIQGWRSGHAD